MLRFIFQIFLFSVPGITTGFAQNFAVKNYTVDEDLPFASVKSSAQLENGYFYIASESQLARFDGISFHKIPIIFHRQDDKILTVQASNKTLILQSNNGFYLIDQDNRQKYISIDAKDDSDDVRQNQLTTN